jgi:hypothetical protein
MSCISIQLHKLVSAPISGISPVFGAAHGLTGQQRGWYKLPETVLTGQVYVAVNKCSATTFMYGSCMYVLQGVTF